MVRKHEINGVTWYWLCRRFKDADTAKRQFDFLNTEAKKHEGKLGLGCYRHGPSNEQKRYVTCVSHDEEGMTIADMILGGTNYTLADDVVEALIMRRARIVVDLVEQGAASGVHEFHHEGMQLTRGGEVVPRD